MVAIGRIDGDDVVRDAVLAERMPDYTLSLRGHRGEFRDAREMLLLEEVDQIGHGRGFGAFLVVV